MGDCQLRVVISDGCRTGLTRGTNRGSKARSGLGGSLGLRRAEGIMEVTACGPGQASYNSTDGSGMGLFTSTLVREIVKNPKACLNETFNEVNMIVHKKTEKRQPPHYKPHLLSKQARLLTWEMLNKHTIT